MIPLTVPEVRRLVLAMAGSVEERDFRLGWSVWRRAHQAVAARCKKASRAARATLRREGSSEDHAEPKVITLTPEEARLTDAEWERVHPLLPPQRGRVGRPPNAIIARCSAASCGSSGPAARGERCLRSTETGRLPTTGGGHGRSAACGNVSSERWETKSCPDRRPKTLTDAVGTIQAVEKRAS